jgi:DUF4097 and DUF4098 domain-containing protein YvlB
MKVKVFIVLLLFMVAFSFAANHEETIEKTFKMDKNGEFSIKNINGMITIHTHDKNEALVKATKSAKKKEDLANIKVNFDYSGNTLKVTTKRDKFRSNVKVNYEVWLPENLQESTIKTVNGAVDIDGKFKRVNSSTVNGKLHLQGSIGDAEFETVNGSIGVYCKTKLAGNIEAQTVNGSVKMEFPKKSHFKFEADTLNGSISSDFSQISIKKGFIGKSAKGVIGDGNHKVSVETVNGSIKILGN